jgi:hypothetical protein
MTSVKSANAPRPAPFLVGRDEHGFWVARSADGREGGLFASRAEAEKFARQSRLQGAGVAYATSAPLDLWK